MNDPENPYAEEDFDNAARLVKQRQRFRRGAVKAVNVINNLLARKGYSQTRSTNELTDVWIKVAGPRWKDKTIPGNISRGVLEITVANSSIGQHLSFSKKKLLAGLQAELPQNKIRDIRFRVGTIS